jgi:hypothetical protein
MVPVLGFGGNDHYEQVDAHSNLFLKGADEKLTQASIGIWRRVPCI